AIGVPAAVAGIGGFVIGVREHTPLLQLLGGFVPTFAVAFAFAILGELVRSRRELAARTKETIEREAAQRGAQERLRIAREAHDTVARGMATIAVQAAGALQVRPRRPDEAGQALTAIRETSKEALAEMRATLGVLRQEGPARIGDETAGPAGLERLPQLLEA